MEKTAIVKRRELSVKGKMLWTVAALAAAVALPQLLHTIGIISGTGTAMGEIFLPMHLPIMLAGFFAGPIVGAAAGILAPILSHYMTAMPPSALLPFMVIELFAYGLSAGFLKDIKIPSAAKVLAVQIIGRVIRAIAIVVAVKILEISSLNISIIWLSVKTGILGIAIQLLVIPALMRLKGKSDE